MSDGVYDRVTIALVNPPDIRPSLKVAESQAPPLGLASVASFLRAHNFHCDLFDLASEHPLAPTFLDEHGFFEYDVYGFTSYTKTFLASTALARLVRERRPDAIIVFGGPHATADASSILRRFSEIDAVVRNEGEQPMLSLAQHLSDYSVAEADIPGLVYRRGFAARMTTGSAIEASAICSNEAARTLPDIDDLPDPLRAYVVEPSRTAYELRSGERRRIEFLSTSRGCPKRCNFCSIIVMSPRYRSRSVKLLMREIKKLYDEQSFGHVCFHDANFFANWRRALDLARAMYEWRPEITWSGTATVDTIVRQADSVSEVGALNCIAMEVGIENGSDSVLKRLNKGITVDQCLSAIRILRDSGIHLDLDYIMFDSETSIEELNQNVEFLRDAELSDYAPFDHLRNVVRLYPGTEARTRAMSRFRLSISDFEETLIAPFESQEVQVVYQQMNSFLEAYGADIRGLVSQLEQHAISVARTGSVRESQKMFEIAISLRNLPYKLFRQSVHAAGAGHIESLRGIAEESFDRLSHLLDETHFLAEGLKDPNCSLDRQKQRIAADG